MKLLSLLILLPLCIACNQQHSGKSSSNNKLGMDTATKTYAVESEDASMNAAIGKAKKTIGEFDKAFKFNGTAYTDFAVKKRYKTPGDGGEHMWIAVISLVDNNYRGIVNNDPDKTMEVKYGDTVMVNKEDITDWMYLDNNKLRGGFTIREIRDQLNKEQRIKFDKELGFKIED